MAAVVAAEVEVVVVNEAVWCRCFEQRAYIFGLADTTLSAFLALRRIRRDRKHSREMIYLITPEVDSQS